MARNTQPTYDPSPHVRVIEYRREDDGTLGIVVRQRDATLTRYAMRVGGACALAKRFGAALELPELPADRALRRRALTLRARILRLYGFSH